jgi:hypothetical protein
VSSLLSPFSLKGKLALHDEIKRRQERVISSGSLQSTLDRKSIPDPGSDRYLLDILKEETIT